MNVIIPRAVSLREARAKHNLNRPSLEAQQSTVEATRVAIDELIVQEADKRDTSLKAQNKSERSIAYTPQGSSTETSLRIVEQQNDPLEPPRHRYCKPKPFSDGTLIASAESHAPILRPKPAKLSKEEKQAWDVPASVSNWKNGRGFLIDLETRAARSATQQQATPSNERKQADLASALSAAAEDLADESLKLTEQQQLRQKLRDQRRKRQDEETANHEEELFDSRLFRDASKSRQEVYDTSLFGPTKKKRSYRSVEFNS